MRFNLQFLELSYLELNANLRTFSIEFASKLQKLFKFHKLNLKTITTFL